LRFNTKQFSNLVDYSIQASHGRQKLSQLLRLTRAYDVSTIDFVKNAIKHKRFTKDEMLKLLFFYSSGIKEHDMRIVYSDFLANYLFKYTIDNFLEKSDADDQHQVIMDSNDRARVLRSAGKIMLYTQDI